MPYYYLEQVKDGNAITKISNGNSYIKFERPLGYIKLNEKLSFMLEDFCGIFPCTPYTVIDDIYVDPDERYKGIGSTLIEKCINACKDRCILAGAGASVKEYPEEPSNDEMVKITNKVSKFYEKNNFVDINDIIGNYEFKRTMMYIGNDIGKSIYEKIKEMRNEQ